MSRDAIERTIKGIKRQFHRRLLARILITVICTVIGSIVIYFLADWICGQYTWYTYQLSYEVLSIIRMLAPILVIGLCLLVTVGVCAQGWNRTLEYLSETLNAAEEITDERPGQITLSPALQDVEMQLNYAKLNLRESRSAAKEAEQRKNDLIVYLAHDLKTPLTSVIGYLSLLHDEQSMSADLREKYTDIALDKALRLEDLINEFFEITRFNLTAVTLEPQTVSLSRMLEQIVFEFQPMLTEKNLSVRLSCPPGLTLTCDPDKMQRVLDNVLRNAVNYSFSDGEICLSALRTGNRIEIVCQNKGQTIPPEKLEHIFDQFYRLDAARSSKTGGAGLGLAIAKQLVDLHGGSISAKSADQTFTMTIRLPCREISTTF